VRGSSKNFIKIIYRKRRTNMEFNIGDRVRVKPYESLPKEIRNKGTSRLCGCDGEIVDKLWSGAKGCTVYKVWMDGATRPSRIDFPSNAIDLVSELCKKMYTYEFEYLDKVVVARFYEVGEDHKTEIAIGHGHIIHEDEVGIAQAASYALKRIYQKILEKQ
jgi:hypothetical protein